MAVHKDNDQAVGIHIFCNNCFEINGDKEDENGNKSEMNGWGRREREMMSSNEQNTVMRLYEFDELDV